MIETFKQKVLEGGALTDDEAYLLAETEERETLYEAAAEITRHFEKPDFNPCSIVNAWAGQCSENCKWCAQSAHYATHAGRHGIVSKGQVLPDSIPINILSPIAGTPLADTPPIEDDEILLTVALFRFLHPKAELRFAGGRKRLSREVHLRALHIGINAAVVGDLLTTVGSRIDEDRQLAEEAGYR